MSLRLSQKMTTHFWITLINLWFLQGMEIDLNMILSNLNAYQSLLQSATNANTANLDPLGAVFIDPTTSLNGFMMTQNPSGGYVTYSTGIHNSNAPFGTNKNYIAQNFGNNVVIASTFLLDPTSSLYTKSWDTSDQADKILDNQQIMIFDRTFTATAFRGCRAGGGTVVHLHIFLSSSLVTYSTLISTLSYNINIVPNQYTFMISLYFFLTQSCSQSVPISRIVETLLYIAFKDAGQPPLNTVMSNVISNAATLASISAILPYQCCISKYYHSYVDGNTQVQVGNLLVNAAANNVYDGFTYSDSQIQSNTKLGPAGWGQYFTYYYQQKLFVGVFDVAPQQSNDWFASISFQAHGAYSQCYNFITTFVLGGVTYQFQWSTYYHPCNTYFQENYLSTLLITPSNTSSPLNTQGSSCDPLYSYNQVLSVQLSKLYFPRSRIYYMMFYQSCSPEYSPPSAQYMTDLTDMAKRYLKQAVNNVCHPLCLACGANLNDCTSCDPDKFRTLSGSSCVCMDGYYDMLLVTCQPCHISCATCTVDGPTNCLTCAAGYVFQSGTNLCVACHYSCATCAFGTSANNCLSCTPAVRVASGSTCICTGNTYDDGSNAACATCSYRCATCLTTATNCQSCSATRLLTPGNCPCIDDTYYDDGHSSECIKCPTFCPHCTSPTTCISCNGLQRSGTQCQCATGFYDDSTNDDCATCLPKCQNCAGSASSCLTCAGIHRQTAPACACVVGFYDDGTSADCLPCSTNCYSCSGAAATCTACTGTQKNLVGSVCQCANGYFDDNVNVNQCSYSCLTCLTSASNCQTCHVTRTLQTGNNCICNAGYYDNGIHASCVVCHYSCATCNSGYATNCQSCPSGRTLSAANTCDCPSGMMDDGSHAACVPCNYKCATCVVTTTNCLTCPSNRSPSLQTCICGTGLYDDGSSATCGSCHTTCLTCNGPARTNCLTCDLTIMRTLYTTTCICQTIGYFDDGVSAVCQGFKSQLLKACHYSCLVCSGSASNQCTVCNSGLNRALQNNICGCVLGFFDDLVIQSCIACHYSCLTCSSASMTACTTCQTSYQRQLSPAGSCDCVSPKIDDGVNAACQACSYQCLTCSGNVNTCTSCDPSRLTTLPTCPCGAGFYDDGISQGCGTCHSTCVTCSGPTNTNCITCDSSIQRTLIGSTCTCMTTGYYDDGTICRGTNLILQIACHYTCNQCSGPLATDCNACASGVNRNLLASSCDCVAGYYDDGSQVQCQQCHLTCQTCAQSGATNCLTCDKNLSRIISSGSCVCDVGTYDDTINAQCASCHTSCLTCSGSSNIECLSCASKANRTLNSVNSTCDCTSGYAENSVGQCLLCHYSCTTCNQLTSNGCLTCSNNSFRALNNSICQCQIGYYDDRVNQLCQKCYKDCKSCNNGTLQDCTTCYPTQKMQLISTTSGICVCVGGYLDQKTLKCDKCSSSCFTCQGPTDYDCTSCDPSKNRKIAGGSCICEDGFSLVGTSCISQSFTNYATVPAASKKPECEIPNCKYCDAAMTACNDCQTEYFLDPNTQKNCNQCDERCINCIGPTPSNCISCKYLNTPEGCKLCEEVTGLYTINGICQPKCGDGIIYQLTEQCDDENQVSDDGCSSNCMIEKFYNCTPQNLVLNQSNDTIKGPSICNQASYPSFTVSFANLSTVNGIILRFSERMMVYDCSFFSLNIEGYPAKTFVYTSVLDNQLITQCNITLSLTQSIPANQMITIQIDKNLRSLKTNKLLHQKSSQIASREYIVYTQQQRVQTKNVKSAQGNFNYFALIIGLLVMILGGWEVYWSLMDVLTWTDVLYYFNVSYPLNLDSVYKDTQWTTIFSLPELLQFDQPDKYPNPPLKFFLKGYNTIFLSNLGLDIQIIGIFVTISALAYSISKGLRSFFSTTAPVTFYVVDEDSLPDDVTSHISKMQKPKHPTQIDSTVKYIPSYIETLTKPMHDLSENFISISTKIGMLFLIDFQTAATIQILCGNFYQDPYIIANYLLSMITCVVVGVVLVKATFILQLSKNLLNQKQFLQKYGAFFDGLELNNKVQKLYNIVSNVKKMIFVVVLCSLYNSPMLQTVFCCLLVALNVLYLCYKNPFESKQEYFRNLIPEACLLGSVIVIQFFVLRDQTDITGLDKKFPAGWVGLAFITSSLALQSVYLVFQVLYSLWDKLRTAVQLFRGSK